ncbi:MAG TPA: hypothetical protein VGH44_01960 [Candidatus Saccharimonadia bacterium]|jgi:hypothetical protein
MSGDKLAILEAIVSEGGTITETHLSVRQLLTGMTRLSLDAVSQGMFELEHEDHLITSERSSRQGQRLSISLVLTAGQFTFIDAAELGERVGNQVATETAASVKRALFEHISTI